MSLLALVRRTLRRARARTIRHLEQDIDWARASSDAHIRGLEQRLAKLREKHDDRGAKDVARDISRGEKAELLS